MWVVCVVVVWLCSRMLLVWFGGCLFTVVLFSFLLLARCGKLLLGGGVLGHVHLCVFLLDAKSGFNEAIS